MNRELYTKLVDLYAGYELPAELEDEMIVAAGNDPALASDMLTLRAAVDALQNDQGPSFTEESFQRILMKLYARGVALHTKAPSPTHLQYQLPIQG